MTTPTRSASQARQDEAARFADELDVRPGDLYAAATAIWSNLNPQSTPWTVALSAAGAALRAIKISRWADEVLALIDGDIEAGEIDPCPASFEVLYEDVDANDYLINAGIPFGTDPGAGGEDGFEMVNAVAVEVSRRLAARLAP